MYLSVNPWKWIIISGSPLFVPPFQERESLRWVVVSLSVRYATVFGPLPRLFRPVTVARRAKASLCRPATRSILTAYRPRLTEPYPYLAEPFVSDAIKFNTNS